MNGNGGTRIIKGENGDVGRVIFSRMLRWFVPVVGTAFVGGIFALVGEGFLIWREQAVTNAEFVQVRLDVAALQRDLRDRVVWDDTHVVTRSEWIAANTAAANSVVAAVDSLHHELSWLASGNQHNLRILERLPGAKETP